ncbi:MULTISPECIES: Na+/H+ antiporter subunit E [Methanocalculus]|uniref:Na+/H+ antiporter subunit E n=1 Tax=Methanocalculus TaxID=71151 RepID=UPI00209F6F10|nr:Na+/H+ antiporter subunit E [Methanocalculus sp. AMF5]MCP1661878.1 multicomponent Na+:H+ antiporter subunit E [Methanocalculus sp. AMF5]
MTGRKPFQIILTAVILFLFWIILSGYLDPVHLGMGIIASSLIAWFFPVIQSVETRQGIREYGVFLLHLIPYILRLQVEIIRANIEVIWITLHPNLPISPAVRRFKTDLTSPTALTTFGNSITLTPGTLTLDINSSGDTFIHYLKKPDPGQQKTTEIRDAVATLFSGGNKWKQS